MSSNQTDIAPTIDEIAFFAAFPSIVGPIFILGKIYKIFVDFCFGQIVNYCLFPMAKLYSTIKIKN